MLRTASTKARSRDAVARGVGGGGVGTSSPQWQLALSAEIDARGVTPTRLAQIVVENSANTSAATQQLVDLACTRLQDLWIERNNTNMLDAGFLSTLKAAGLLAKHVPEKFLLLQQRLD